MNHDVEFLQKIRTLILREEPIASRLCFPAASLENGAFRQLTHVHDQLELRLLFAPQNEKTALFFRLEEISASRRRNC